MNIIISFQFTFECRLPSIICWSFFKNGILARPGILYLISFIFGKNLLIILFFVTSNTFTFTLSINLFCSFRILISSGAWRITFSYPISLLFWYKRTISFSTMTYIIFWWLLAINTIIRYSSLLQISFLLLIKSFLTCSKCLMWIMLIYYCLKVWWNTTNR